MRHGTRRCGLAVGVVLVGLMAPTARGQWTVGIDPPTSGPGPASPGVGWIGNGYSVTRPDGRRGYMVGLPDLGYYNAGGGPSPYYSPVFNAMAAAPREDRVVPSAAQAIRPRRAGLLRGLFGRR